MQLRYFSKAIGEAAIAIGSRNLMLPLRCGVAWHAIERYFSRKRGRDCYRFTQPYVTYGPVSNWVWKCVFKSVWNDFVCNVQVQGYEFDMACLLRWHDLSGICFNDLYLAM